MELSVELDYVYTIADGLKDLSPGKSSNHTGRIRHFYPQNSRLKFTRRTVD